MLLQVHTRENAVGGKEFSQYTWSLLLATEFFSAGKVLATSQVLKVASDPKWSLLPLNGPTVTCRPLIIRTTTLRDRVEEGGYGLPLLLQLPLG